jgi:hypothetical protein
VLHESNLPQTDHQIEECFHLSALSFTLTYADDDGEDFTVRTEADLTEAILYFASGDDDASLRSGSGSQQKIVLRLEVVVEYDGPSLSDTSSLRSFESGSGTDTGTEEDSASHSGSSWRSSSYYSHTPSGAAGRELEDVDEEDLGERMTVVGLGDLGEGGSARRPLDPGPSSHMTQSELGSRWLREQEALARRNGGSARGKMRRRDDDDEDDSDQEMGDLNLIRDAKGKYYYAYGSHASSSAADDYMDTRSALSLPPRPDIPVTGLAIEPGAPPVLAPDCSACGTRLDYMRYVCTTCGEGDLWKENAPARLPPTRPGALSDADESAFSDSTEGPAGSYTEYDPRPRSRSTATGGSMEAVSGGLLTPPRSPLAEAADRRAIPTGYELCPACIEEHGIAHAKAASRAAKLERAAGTRRSRRLARHAFTEKIWGLEGWTDIGMSELKAELIAEYNEDVECTICHTHLTRSRFRCVSCPKFDMCKSCKIC